MLHCCLQAEEANTGFKNSAKEQDSVALAEERGVQRELTQRMTQKGDVTQPKDSCSGSL